MLKEIEVKKTVGFIKVRLLGMESIQSESVSA